jgi:hypothetical protein
MPETGYTLYYNSVKPSDDQQLSFVAGNGQPPATASQAQLLNAACQVAFGKA